jgi:cytochrome P450
VHQILHDPETFSSYPNSIVAAGGGRLLPLELDPPDHTAFRNVLQPMFSPPRMAALETEMRTIITELIDSFIERGECEFVAEFAHELPARVFLAQMGLPVADAPLFSEWTQTLLVGAPGGSEEESTAARGQAMMDLGMSFATVIAERRGQPLSASSDVTSLIINSPLKLEDEPERLLTDEEILRIEAAVAPGRRVTRDCELGGIQLKADDQLLMLLCAANRDADAFDDPEQLSLERKPNRHLSFGGGRHRCIGSHLARVELRIAFEEIHRRLPDYELADPPVFHSTQTRGVLSMPIRFTPGTRSA